MSLIKMHSTKKTLCAFENDLIEVEDVLHAAKFQLEDIKLHHFEERIEEALLKRINKLEKSYYEVDLSDYENVHDVRKEAKKIRYAVGGFKKWLSKKQRKKIAKRAKNIQVELGKYTDTFANKVKIEIYRKKTEKESLATAFTKLLKHQ